MNNTVTAKVAQAFNISENAVSLRLEASKHIVDMNWARTVSYTVVQFRISGMDKVETFDIRTESLTFKGTDSLENDVLKKICSFESTKNIPSSAKEEMAIAITEHIARMNWASTNNRANGTFRNTVMDREVGEGEGYIGYFNASTYVQPGDNYLNIPLQEEFKRRQNILGTNVMPA